MALQRAPAPEESEWTVTTPDEEPRRSCLWHRFDQAPKPAILQLRRRDSDA